MKSKILRMILACLVMLAPARPSLQAGTKEDFEKAVSDLQSDPGNMGLRKKILQLAGSLKSLPETPEQVAILQGKAAYMIKNADSPAGYLPAVDAYQKASLLAPWIPELYYNLGLVQEKAGDPKGAMDSFNLYLSSNPEAEDRNKVLARLGALEAQQEQRAKAAVTAGAVQRANSEDALKSWQGRRDGQAVVGITSGVILGLGLIFSVSGLLIEDGAKSYSSAGVRDGVNYNKYSEGSYWSEASYGQHTDGQGMMAAGITFFVLGGVGAIIALAMDPGPKPMVSLLNLEDGKLSAGLPLPMISQDSSRLTLLQARF
ncbi:MAG: tetratricopeptide repeat protein [candidate division FCPU426 bacterium]